ncbi:MAG: hypothetical protein QOI63_1142 [Thermoplasmata archaeon]|jgi:hypothetical protein|nr:hypothetical protein [Thermoplasmata archaeon]
MLCVNCDHPLPPDAAACPGCGAQRLQLLVSPATEASMRPPRRRGRGWGVLALLLCAAVVVALAGQASQSHGGSSGASTPPKAHGKAKAPAVAHPTPAPEPDVPVVSVSLGSVPDGGPDPDRVLAAARAALQDWASAGVELREADAGQADVALEFVLQGEGSGQPHVGTVPLGDSACGAWSAYSRDSLEALAARALGLAMGRDGPARLMGPVEPRYDGGCQSNQGTLTIGRGQSDGKAFRLAAAATVGYTMEVQDGYADACLLAPSEWDAFAAGEGGGAACSYAATSGGARAALEPGSYVLGFRCVEASPACHVSYTLSAQ